jgi:putative membrane protein
VASDRLGAAHNKSFGPARTALDILNERFARGEIDQAEYEEKRRLISQG